jgi:peptidoglycan hydrolase-like protein with peptidoglycan-binding domain
VGASLVLLAAGAAAVAIVDPFGGTGTSSADAFDSGAATSLASVTRQDLSSQTQVSATLGYADASTISVPAGTAPSAVLQAQQTVTTARSTLEAAQGTLADDARALDRARATYAADRRKQAIDCGGDNAAQSGSTSESAGSSAPCATDSQAVATDEQAVTAAVAKVEADRRSVSAAQTALASAEQALAAAESAAAAYDQTSVYTMLPAVGRVIRLGQPLYAIGGQPVVLLYGSVTPWRPFASGMTPGRDVAELNRSLRTLHYGAPVGDAFTFDTEAAIRAFQAARGLAVTGRLLLGSVVFEPGAVRVTSVTPTRGAAVQAGAVLGVTSIRRQVTIALDASQQRNVKVGDPVTITLPDNSTTPGRVSYVGTVATTPSSDNGQSQTPTIEVDVKPLRPAETGRLDKAPVDVSITTATVENVLAVPVNALLALASGGYAVEQVRADGTRRLLRVELGLFDDAEGLVEVSGPGLAAGQRVVVPSS